MSTDQERTMSTDFEHFSKAVDLLTALHLSGTPKRALGADRAADRLQSHRWGWRSNLIGVGVARKVADGKAGDPLCITFYVRRKSPKSRLHPKQIVPAQLRLRALGRTVLTDLVEVPGTLICHAPDDRVRPLQPGVEVSHVSGPGLGSLCAIVQRGGKVFGLGCSHVLARCGIDLTPAGPSATPRDERRSGECSRKTGRRTTTIDFKHPNTEDCALFEIDSAGGTPSNRIAGQDRSISEFDGRTPAQLIASKVETELYGIHTQGQPGKIFALPKLFRRQDAKAGHDPRQRYFHECGCIPHTMSGRRFRRCGSRKRHRQPARNALAGVPGFGLFIPAGPMFTNHGLKLFA